MRLAVLLAVLPACGACAIPRAYGEGVGIQTLFSGGGRVVDHPELEGHPVVGLEFATHDPKNGWGYEIGGVYGSEGEGGPRDEEIEVPELTFGLRRSWVSEERSLQPYVGFGGSIVRVETRLHDPNQSFTNDSGGGYVRGGLLWSLGTYGIDHGTEVLVGLDARAVVGDEVEAGQLAFVLGFGR